MQVLTPPVHQIAPERNRPWREWTAAIAWVIVIAIESTPRFSAQNTAHWLAVLLLSIGRLGRNLDLKLLNEVGRKIGHIIGYGTLSFLMFRAWRANCRDLRRKLWAFSWSAAALLTTVAVASLDEWHQTFLPSRTGTIKDVFLDGLAALAVQYFLFVFLWNRRGANPNREPC